MASPQLNLVKALDGGQLEPDRAYGKSDLIAAVSDATGIPWQAADKWFTQFSSMAGSTGRVGSVSVRVEGERKGRRYFLSSNAQTNSATTLVPSYPTENTAPKKAVSPKPAHVDSISPTEHRLDIHFSDNLPLLKSWADHSFDMIYIDPPFNTGKVQSRTRIQTVRDDESGDRVGFQGKKYKTTKGATTEYADAFDDFAGFIQPRLVEAHRLLKPTGSFFFHIDYREVHYCKVLLDSIFGRECFQNEIIWAYDYGGRSKKKWSAKHDNILWYTKHPTDYTFNFEEMDRIPYMAPGLVGAEKAAKGKTPTDVWWHTIVPTNGKERTGYATQKPLGVLERIIKVHSDPGDLVLDFFAGSGTTGEAAIRNGRNAVLVDSNEQAIEVMQSRLDYAGPKCHGATVTGRKLSVESALASQHSLFQQAE